ncbi:MAG: polyprenyl synthetase family protein [Anaerolineales bacterium]
MGWTGEGAGVKAQGKRIRPLLLLLVAEAVGGDIEKAMPAAAAVEILHNFSLIHDDIEDNSPTRRGRETLWKRHGIPLAINAGDSMFTLAFQALAKLSDHHTPERCLKVYKLFTQTCLSLTKGQHLDISFERSANVQVPDYLEMIQGKTAALLSGSAEIGALLGGATPNEQETYKDLGNFVGLGFQAHDDLLGIWGDADVTGKSTSSDLLARKKTLPVLYGLEQSGRFADMWEEKITEVNAAELALQLKNEGAYDYTKNIASEYTQKAMNALETAMPKGYAGEALSELIHSLVQRSF